MSLQVTLVTLDGVSHEGHPVYLGDAKRDFVAVPGFPRCPVCDEDLAEDDCKLFVHGTGITHHDYDTHYADAVALCCRRPVGQLLAKVSTIFGIDEDRAVLTDGRCRVY
jgi:hypothetical protein